MNEQRRHYSRIGFDSPARLLIGSESLALRVVDLSLHGALLELSAESLLPCGAAAELRVYLDQVGTEICMQTTVVHVEGRRAGLVGVSIDVDSVTHLRRLVELNLGSPDLLQREISALLSE